MYNFAFIITSLLQSIVTITSLLQTNKEKIGYLGIYPFFTSTGYLT